MRAARLFVPLFPAVLGLLLSCTAPNELYEHGRDGPPPAAEDQPSPPADAAMSVDQAADQAATLACGAIAPLVEAMLRNSTACRLDDDCVLARTACGLYGACGDVYANKEWRTADMERMLRAWSAQRCGPDRCSCPEGVPAPPACNEGMCGPRRTTPKGPVGAPCKTDADCQTGQCLTAVEDPPYIDGYCTIKGCNETTKRCPAGSTCRGLTHGAVRICLDDCRDAVECRKGYGCCAGPGPALGRWCAPERSFLCLGL